MDKILFIMGGFAVLAACIGYGLGYFHGKDARDEERKLG